MAELVLTEEGKKKLEEELVRLKEVDKPAILARLKEARDQGDLSENSDYDAARAQQGQVEARIREVEAILTNAKILKKVATNTESVHVGQIVTVTKVGENTKKKYQIVGTTEADPLSGKISNESALAKAIIGKKKGDVCDVNAKVPYQVKIVSIDVK